MLHHDMNGRRGFVFGALVCAVAVLAPGAKQTAADVYAAQWFSSDEFLYSIHHMPDFDQRRLSTPEVVGLLSDGAMYCAPTSATNALVYIANHGFPNVQPGPETWLVGNPTHYDDITWFLGGNIGGVMGTHPTDGTGGTGWYDGIRAYLPESQFTVSAYYSNSTWATQYEDLAMAAIQGSLVVLGYGFYDQIGMVGNAPELDRVGGHCITLAKASAGIFTGKEIFVRDPADDPADTTQSPFVDRKFHVIKRAVVIDGNLLFMDNFRNDAGTPTSAYLDGYILIKPKQGYSFTPGSDIISFFFPPGLQILGMLEQDTPQITLDEATIHDATLQPNQDGYAVLCEPSDGTETKVSMVDLAADSVVDLAPVPGGKKIVYGRNRRLYVLTDDEIICLNPENPDDPVEGSAPLPGVFDDIGYDDAGDHVVVISQEERIIQKYMSTLPAGAGPMTFNIPAGVPMSGQVTTAMRPELGDGSPCYWMVSDASNSAWGMTITTTATESGELSFVEVALADVNDPTCISFDDAGDMFVTAEGHVHQASYNMELEEWATVPDEEANFGGMEVGTCFFTSCSRSNIIPDVHNGPGWDSNLESDQLLTGEAFADCPADSNEDRVVDVLDLLKVLGDWGPCESCIADTNGDRTIDVLDLLEVLGNWGACD